MVDIRERRLEVIKLKMIKRYLSEMNLDNEYDLYDTLLYKTFITGEFDDVFLSNNIESLDNVKRQEVIDLARKYNSLCFYNGQFDYWMDSLEGVTRSDYDLICEKLLDNFDYLMRLAKNGGEDVLKFLNKFISSDEFKKSSIISSLRPGFSKAENSKGFDDILETVLIEMSKKNGLYKDFSDTQKIVMCDNLDGVVYRKTDDKQYELIPVDELKDQIMEAYGEDDYPINGIELDTFQYIIDEMYSGYQQTALKR